MGFLGPIGGIVWLICAVWVIIDVWNKQKGINETNKILWTIAALIGGLITAIIYYIVVKNK